MDRTCRKARLHERRRRDRAARHEYVRLLLGDQGLNDRQGRDALADARSVHPDKRTVGSAQLREPKALAASRRMLLSQKGATPQEQGNDGGRHGCRSAIRSQSKWSPVHVLSSHRNRRIFDSIIEIALIETRVERSPCKKLGMCTRFDDSAAVEHVNSV